MNMIEAGAIVSQIKEKMVQEGLNVHSLEKRAGLKPNAVHNILSGRSKNPTIYILQSVAKALNCTVSDLIGEESPSPSLLQEPEQTYSHAPHLFKNSELYILCLDYISSLLKKKKLWLKREQVINYADEIYLYSLKKSSDKVDVHFANWLIERS